MKEIYKPVLGYEDKYLVSNHGNIKSISRGRILSPKNNHDGYLRIQLWRNSKCEYRSIHVIVMEAFSKKPFENAVVNHINGVKYDNRLENLEWVTQKENIGHAWKTGLNKRVNKGRPVYIKDLGGHIYSYGNATMTSEALGYSFSLIAKYARENKQVKGLTYSYDYNL